MSNLDNKSSGTNETQVDGYWQDVEQKVLDPKVLSQEFGTDEFDSFSVKKSRRNFLKIMGFSVSAMPLTGCIKIPVKKALPYLNKQDDVIPGVANWYASTFEGTPVLVKTREGRPIKIEGNDKSKTTMGGANARAQASVLSLYDSYRLRSPMVNGSSLEWDQFDSQFAKAMSETTGEVVIVTPSITSPTELKLLKSFIKKYGATHIAYDAVSRSAFAEANEITHGVFNQSEYNFEQADVVLSFGADFLGTFGNDVANTRQYSKRRNAKHSQGMNKHYHIEPMMTLTGSNADYRYTRSAVEERDILLGVLAGVDSSFKHSVQSENKEIVTKMVNDLKASSGKSLVLSGHNDVNTQVVVNKINALLGNYGQTVFATKTESVFAKDADMVSLVDRMNAGSVGGLVMIGVNPSYNYFQADKFNAGLNKVKVSTSFTLAENETSKLTKFVAPMNHTYESWSDSMVSSSELSITQPVIQPLFGTRMWTESMMNLLGVEGTFHDYLKSNWSSLDWSKTLHDGVVIVSGMTSAASKIGNINSYAAAIKNTKSGTGLNIVAYTKYGIENGDMANNPFLQELPNPITKATWDNYAMVSPSFAKTNGLKSGDEVELTDGKIKMKLPCIVQPGTETNTVAVALGYGHTVGGKVAKNLGRNAYPFVSFDNTFNYCGSYGALSRTGKKLVLAQTQTHHSMEGRDIVRETTFSAFQENPKSGNQVHKPKTVHIYPAHKKDGHQWGMAINLSSCTGCSACIISCSAENNVPVVGKQEVANKRDMHWLRLDRYYKGDENQPEVMHMPMLCQHCDNAPCENVCPVLATVQSSDGLNQQIYNRCVGTRYCANNCPYKVRRFNWFNYDHSDAHERLALNPDVGVRSRGIMEKCSMCIQRIQEGKLTAKRERRELADGDIKVACQQSCPSDNAIIFGDIKDPNSEISQYLEDDRQYTVLEELNVQPRVNYLTKIRNK